MKLNRLCFPPLVSNHFLLPVCHAPISGETTRKRSCPIVAVRTTQRARCIAMGTKAVCTSGRNTCWQCFWLGCKGGSRVRLLYFVYYFIRLYLVSLRFGWKKMKGFVSKDATVPCPWGNETRLLGIKRVDKDKIFPPSKDDEADVSPSSSLSD